MPRAFHLEHADRLAAPEHFVSLGIVERDFRQVDLDAAPRQQPRRRLQRGQRLQAEEVEFHEARRLDPFHVELRRRHFGFRVAIERHQFDQRPVADHDARRMGRGVGIEPFQPLGDRQHLGDARIGLGRFAEARLVDDRLFQRDRIGGVLRHQLGELVDLAERHFQHAPDIAHDAARQERAEGDDLRDAVGAVALADIGDHLVAPVLAEVDVEVGHRHALGIEEALEQQAEADRIEIGDRQRIGDQRAGARTAPRPDRNVLPLGPLDEIGDDQEIAGEFHLDDDVELEGEPLRVIVLDKPRRAAVIGEPCRRARRRPARAIRRLRRAPRRRPR